MTAPILSIARPTPDTRPRPRRDDRLEAWVVAEEHRPRLAMRNAVVPGTVLVDGFARAAWKLTRAKGTERGGGRRRWQPRRPRDRVRPPEGLGEVLRGPPTSRRRRVA
ncbi:MAG TPA: hypothetical protein VK306_04400 [Acidimicrobiales bacterium]|nr:hypothetical protein [Acidimicrobiales bacterium]